MLLHLNLILRNGCCKKTEQDYKHHCRLSQGNLWTSDACSAEVAASTFELTQQQSWDSPESKEDMKEKDAAEECLKFKINKETGHYFRSFAAKFNMPSGGICIYKS